jgi:DNA-binding response OmpR family regulator
MQLMDLLMSNVNGGFVTKRKIFIALWDDQGEDDSRVVDQIIFKIKKKLGKQVFEITKKGIKII